MGLLAPFTRNRRLRSFLVYDLEWIPGTLEVRVAGVYDRERGYRSYRTIRDFLQSELTSRNRGRWFYAHAGGLADVQFVLDELVQWNLRNDGDCPFKVRASFSGSSAIIVKVTRGHNVWYFIDSYWLLRDKLKNIGKFLGMQKGGMDDPDETLPDDEWTAQWEAKRRWYAEVPFNELRSYNEQDCLILYNAVYEFEARLLDMGGQLQMTLASSAMFLFRRTYLTQEIDTSDAVNARAQLSYFASRVEVLRRRVSNANYFDINSCFPHAMTFPCPGEYIGASSHLPDHGLYIADVEIEVPEIFLPPMPMRTKGGRIFFPTGKWRGWFTSVDIELLQECGGRLLKSHEVMKFEAFHDLSNYANDLYNTRAASKDPFERLVLKLALNSLYGKFAESKTKISLWIDPDDTSGMEMLFPGAFLSEEEIEVEHAHVPISSFITSYGRRFLYEFMSQCYEVFYCDTDGFATTEKLPTSNKLGGLKLEKVIEDGFFVQPKVYHMKIDQSSDVYQKELAKAIAAGDPPPPTVMNKAKGFSRMNTERFFALAEGATIPFERMMRIRERMRMGFSNPVEKTIEKRLLIDQTIPKRFTYPDGYTRPWHVSEISHL